MGDDAGTFRWLRAGRQETAYGGERLIGTVGWAQQGRSFDGVRLATGRGAHRLDFFGFQLGDPDADPERDDAELAGAYGVLNLGAEASLDLFGIFRRVHAPLSTREGTFGARYAAEGREGWAYRFEAALQTGTRRERDVSAGMLGARVGRAVGESGRVTLWYDYLSGDDDPEDGEAGAFSTLFATNHKFYGHADLFLDIPAHTAGGGLQDAALKLSLTPWDRLGIGVDLHHFRLASAPEEFETRLGEEIDVDVTYRSSSGLAVQGGGAWVHGGHGLVDVGRLNGNLLFGYLMLTAAF